LLIAHLLSRDYIEALKPQDPDQLGSASLLLFGPAGEISAELAPLIGSYRLPPHADGNVALSFGVGASGSGVPFHVHGHGWAECIHGAKVLMVVSALSALLGCGVPHRATLSRVAPAAMAAVPAGPSAAVRSGRELQRLAARRAPQADGARSSAVPGQSTV